MTQYLPTYVRAPIVTPLPYGLMSVVQMPTDDVDKVHWRNGIQFQGTPCDPAQTTQDPCPAAGSGFVKPPTSDGIPTRGAQTFTVFAELECNPIGYWPDADARITDLLTRGEARAVEETFWSGAINAPTTGITYPHLASDEVVYDSTGVVLLQTAAQVVTGWAVDILQGVGLLEGALARCFGGVGVIHAPPEALSAMAEAHLISPRGGTMYTAAGIPVAFGSGYLTTGPDGTPASPGNAWLYATGPIMLRRSEIRVTATPTQSLNRSVNTLTMIAERDYNIAWDCCHFAIQVSLGGIITGAAGSAV